MLAQSPSFGLMLRRHRRAEGMTQEELAEGTGVSVRAIGDLERGLRQPRKDTLQILLETLKLAPDERARLEAAARSRSTSYLPSGAGATEGEPLPTGGVLGALPSTPLIEREPEVERVAAAIDAVIGGGARLLLLTGEPGIGKTRLAQHVAVEADARGLLVLTGRCYESEQSVPFYPFLDVLATAYRRVPRAMQEDILHRWPSLRTLLPEDVSGDSTLTSDARSTDPEEQQRLFRAVGGFLHVISEMMPVALLLDDLHWADDASLKLVLHLARHSLEDRILLLATYRDVEIDSQHPLQSALVDLNRERLLERIVLHRLDLVGTGALMGALLDDANLCPEVERSVYDSTDGNPFFIQEVLLELVERGDLERTDGCLAPQAVGGYSVPDTVQALIQQQLLRLDSAAQLSLHQASVLGRTFSFRDLQALSGQPAEDLDEALQAAVAVGLLQETGVGFYAFNHALSRQALYQNLSSRRRQTLHLAAGETLHGLPEPERMQRAAELARHFRLGGDRVRAAAYGLLAGDRATRLHAYGEAERHLREAVEVVAPDDGQPADVAVASAALAALGHVLQVTERYEDALSILERAAELYRTQGNLEGEARVVTEIGWIHRSRGTAEEGLGRLQPAIERLEREHDSSWERGALAGLYSALAGLYSRLGRRSDELAAAEHAARLARDSGDAVVPAPAQERREMAPVTNRR